MSAVISTCGMYRYRLEREVALDGPAYAFIGINPSTADACVDDATVRKWIGFVTRWGGRRFIVGNVFAYRATDVRALASAVDPVGPKNDGYLAEIFRDADIIVPCWGARSKLTPELLPRLDMICRLLSGATKSVMTFGFTASGDPKHPLMLGYDTALQPWRQPK
ncbi:DUF1643 domain-containing protein [Burkholderia ubonensis]|uniref:DUF1643 domain-containing protein n=1 Tax=Burkholderia ubonensis TaxID=101571 RepID=UPI000753DB16|nr:DUF1643 domain-containing protein [Burkholderia ubonensis]KVO11738.1 hypothetical protein WJ73_19510 [Burkholderia ubonensis]